YTITFGPVVLYHTVILGPVVKFLHHHLRPCRLFPTPTPPPSALSLNTYIITFGPVVKHLHHHLRPSHLISHCHLGPGR
ncbi:hypothetical protein P692DRAFT_201728720, partial [Suillus brevipes Sb2]